MGKDSVHRLSGPLTGYGGRGTLGGMQDEPQESRDAIVSPATIQATARVHTPGIRIQTHLWPTWGEIAIDEEANARSARAEHLKLAAGKQNLGNTMTMELRASMVSIVAASHSLDALYGVLADFVIEPELRQKWRERRETGKKGPPRHRQVLETIRRSVVLDAGTLDRWAADFAWLFRLRDQAVHHQEEMAEPVPHPAGTTNSGAIYASYCVETAGRAVELLLEVLGHVVSSPRSNKADVVKWVEDFASAAERLRERRSGG